MARTIRPVRGSTASAALAALSAACAFFTHGAVAGDPTSIRDERGKSLLLPEPSRTPSGLLYEWPYEVLPPARFGGDWSYRLATEFGVLRGEGDAPQIRNYGDYRDGFVLNHFSFGLERAASAHYFDLTAGAVGRDDQHYRASFGRHGDFRGSVFFIQTPTSFTDRARTVFQGAGSGNLTLVPGLTPGNNTGAQVNAALQSASPFAIGFTRRKAGLDVDVTPDANWRFYARYAQDRKDGTRASGGASSTPGTPFAETIEPIDYKTHEVLAGMQWAGDAFQANLAYAGSFFRNGIGTLTWENPLTVGDPAVMQRGRTDLYPDNDSHNLKLDLGATLPMRGRVSGGVSWGRMTQDDDLIAPTVNSGTLGSVDLARWNSTAALSQKSADARIDTRLTHVSASFAPLRDLSLQAKWRRYEESNKTRYAAFNPQTGQSGYLGLDGAVNNIVPDNIFRAQLSSIPFECDKANHGLEGDYQLLRRTNLTLGYERENNECRYREAARTVEKRYRVGLNNRDLAWATIRLSYEHARRTGGDYNYDPNAAFYAPSASLDTPATLAQLRKYDLADREQRALNARVNFLLRSDMDLAVAGKVQSNEYGAAYGRLDERKYAFNLEWNWQPRPSASAYAHYGLERARNRMASINDDPAGYLSGDPNAGGAVYPLANRWDEESHDDTHTVGLGFRYAFGGAVLEAGYTYLYSPYRTRYSFASSGAIAGGAAAALAAGEGMPDMRFRQNTLEASLRFALDRNSALRFYYRYDRAAFEDWHYDGLPLVLGSEAVFLGAGPRSYSASLVGLLYQYAPH